MPAPASATRPSERPAVPGRRARTRVGRLGSRAVRALRSRLRPGGPAPAARTVAVAASPSDQQLRALARSPEVRRRFARAWSFIDRDTMAQDNAEHLYRWVREHRPEVNAWFVLSPGSPDWDRLAAEGFRLVDPAGDDFVLLMLNTEHRISSQVDHYVVNPLDPARFGKARGRFTFLQHGVTKDDLSRWLNPKRISLIVTSTPDEQASIAGDHTPYHFTSKEVALLGMPRHDRLLELGRRTSRPRWLLVAPTWRRSLLDEATEGNSRAARPGLLDSPYFRRWFAVLGSERLQEWAARNGLRLAFLPHPNLDPFVTGGLPAGATLLRYAEIDVQEVLADTALLVTDYSSTAFEAAYLERPVAYLQDDDGGIFDGSHIGRQGSWSYRDDGFGPVCGSLADLEEAVTALPTSDGGVRADEVYAARMRAAFPYRDGRCCERVFDRVRALVVPAPEAVAARALGGGAAVGGTDPAAVTAWVAGLSVPPTTTGPGSTPAGTP